MVTPILESVRRLAARVYVDASCAFGTQIQESGLPIFQAKRLCLNRSRMLNASVSMAPVSLMPFVTQQASFDNA